MGKSLVSRFQGPGGWYIENSLTTLGQKDPVSEENTRLWNTGVDSDKEIVEREKENYHTILTSMWYLIHNIQRTKAKYFCLNTERKSLTRLQKQ